MATEVLIPKLGMTMTEGTVAEWLVPDGGSVRQGEIVYRLETEKINFEVEAEQDGVLRQVAAEGATLAPGTVVGYILAPGEGLPAGIATPSAAAAGAVSVSSGSPGAPATVTASPNGRVVASPIARRLAKEAGIPLAAITGSGPGGRITEQDVIAARARPPQTVSAPARPQPQREIVASPLARRLAEQLHVDLAGVRGSGPGGRITKEDVEQAAASPARPAAAAPSQATVVQAAQRHAGETIPLRGVRKVIAERMHASLQQMAQLTLSAVVVMDEAIKLRAQLIDEWADEGVRPSYSDLITKAVAKALPRHPLLNARVGEGAIELLPEVHIGIAVALADGLVVPVVRDADRLPLKEIARESARLATAARNGTLGLDEMAGGTFSITSLGMYDIDVFTPIVNPPNTAILGVGRLHDATAWEGDRPFRRSELALSLTIDHRAVDGAPAAEFLRAVRDLLQAPYRLLL